MTKTVSKLPVGKMPDWRLLLVSIVFFANAYWFYLEDNIIPNTAFFIVAGIIILWMSWKF
jgi:hypothetical protein